MDESRLDAQERRQIRLRREIARVEHDLAEFRSDPATGSASALASLTNSWQALVNLLAIPEAPVRRDCPHCGGPIMLEATRCVHCWQKSSVQPIDVAGGQPVGTERP